MMYRIQIKKVPKSLREKYMMENSFSFPQIMQEYDKLARKSFKNNDEIELEIINDIEGLVYPFTLPIQKKVSLPELLDAEIEGQLKQATKDEKEVLMTLKKDLHEMSKEQVTNQSVEEKKVHTPQPDQVEEIVNVQPQPTIEPPLEVEQSKISKLDREEFLDASEFTAVARLEKLSEKIDEKINWSSDELFKYFNLGAGEDYSDNEKRDFLLSYDFTIDLKNLKEEVTILASNLEQMAKEDLEERLLYHEEKTAALLAEFQSGFKRNFNELVEKEITGLHDQATRFFEAEEEELKNNQEEEVRLLQLKHIEELKALRESQEVERSRQVDALYEEKATELKVLLATESEQTLEKLQIEQNEELMEYKKTLNHEQFKASSNLIDELQAGERKIIETLFNVLKFNVLKQEDHFKEDYDPYTNLQSNRNIGNVGSRFTADHSDLKERLFANREASVEKERQYIEELKIQNQLLKSRLTTKDDQMLVEESPELIPANERTKWLVIGALLVVFLVLLMVIVNVWLG